MKGCKRAPLDYNVEPMPWPRVANDHPYAKTNAALAEFRKASEKLGRTIASVKTPSRIEETVYLKGEELWSGAEPGWYWGDIDKDGILEDTVGLFKTFEEAERDRVDFGPEDVPR